MDVDTLLSEADLPPTTSDAEAALGRTVARGRRRRARRRLAFGATAVTTVALVAGLALAVDRDDGQRVVTVPSTTLTTVPTEPEPGTTAVWDVDPADARSLRTATGFTALVTRLACSGGVTGEVLRPGVVVTDTEVTISFTVRPLATSDDRVFSCPGNPQVPYEVDIGQPIGDRALVDGACRDEDAAGTSFCENGGLRRGPAVSSP